MPLPWPWVSVEDMDTYVAEFTGPHGVEVSGDKTFIGGLNSYRIADRNWELGAKWADSDITIPTGFIAGSEDPVLKMIRPDAIDIMRSHTPDLRLVEIIPGAGHFVQQDQPAATNKAILKFLDSVRGELK